jgi:hypothetical protein
MPMNDSQILDYIRAAAAALEQPMDDARARAVALHFGRTLAIARVLDDAPLAPHDEPAEVYRPAPFPAEDPA